MKTTIVNNSQKGFGIVPIMVICALLFGAIIFVVYMIFTKPQAAKNAQSKIDTKKIDFTKCISRGYNGCDDEPNYYHWKDDGKP